MNQKEQTAGLLFIVLLIGFIGGSLMNYERDELTFWFRLAALGLLAALFYFALEDYAKKYWDVKQENQSEDTKA